MLTPIKNNMGFSQFIDKEILDIANPLMDNLVDGSTNRDYEKQLQQS